MRRLCWYALLLVALCACDDSDERAVVFDARPAVDAPPPGPDAAVPSLARGKYLVEHVAACGDCHTPRLANGAPNPSRAFAGNPCLIDLTPDDPATGCLAPPNLTSSPDGLGRLTDDQIRAMFQGGVDEQGRALIPVMPYQVYHHLTDTDAVSIVMYLRALPPVPGTVESQPPWQAPAKPAPPIPDAAFPQPSAFDGHIANGRYLASIACTDCHTPRTDPQDFGSYDLTRLFAGGVDFRARSLGLPVPPFPADIFTWNLTPDPTGLQQLTSEQIVNVLLHGMDPQGHGICPPMPSGPMQAFGGLTPSDALDMATYLKAIPRVANPIPADCVPPAGPPP